MRRLATSCQPSRHFVSRVSSPRRCFRRARPLRSGRPGVEQRRRRRVLITLRRPEFLAARVVALRVSARQGQRVPCIPLGTGALAAAPCSVCRGQ
jgi:hypothetical protein